jgi:hypothetical protein
MNNEKNTNRNLSSLSVKQQVGLYVVLTKFYDIKNRPFYSSDFAKEMKKFLLIDNEDDFKRIIGGILGALSKNNILIRVSSDRDPLWKLPEDIHGDPEYYKKELRHIPEIEIRWV